MKSKIRDVGDVRILDLEGKITIGGGDVELRQLVEQSLETGKHKVLLNLAAVSHVDSSGIGEMVGCYTTVARRGGSMKLLNLTQKIQDILTVTQLITVFDVYDNESEAVSSYAQPVDASPIRRSRAHACGCAPPGLRWLNRQAEDVGSQFERR
jgi:anti-sigma B factor antagonist